MKYKCLSFLLAGLILVSIISFYVLSIICVASELENEVEDIQDQIEDHIEIIDDQVEDQQEEEDILQDNYVKLDSFKDQEEDQEEDQEKDQGVFYRKSFSLSRSMINTYTGSVYWQFEATYYARTLRILLSDNTYFNTDVFFFQKDKLPSYDLITRFVNNYKNGYLKMLYNDDYDFYICYNGKLNIKSTSSLLQIAKESISQNGYPDSNCYWSVPEPTGEPTPTITPTVTPTPTGVPEQMPDDNRDSFRIMVIFCFGLCAGVVVGHFLSGFIK